MGLYRDGKVVPLAMNMNYGSEEFREKAVKGLRAMIGKTGPYYIHCTEGKDRTGFFCMLLEAVCGATYEEIVEDYMVSYNLLHKVDINLEVGSDSLQYDLFKTRLDENLEVILNTERKDLPTADLKKKTIEYLLDCGMSQDEIEQLTAILHR